MEPKEFLVFLLLLIAAALAVKYETVRTIILGGMLFATFFLFGWGLL